MIQLNNVLSNVIRFIPSIRLLSIGICFYLFWLKVVFEFIYLYIFVNIL